MIKIRYLQLWVFSESIGISLKVLGLCCTNCILHVRRKVLTNITLLEISVFFIHIRPLSRKFQFLVKTLAARLSKQPSTCSKENFESYYSCFVCHFRVLRESILPLSYVSRRGFRNCILPVQSNVLRKYF